MCTWHGLEFLESEFCCHPGIRVGRQSVSQGLKHCLVHCRCCWLTKKEEGNQSTREEEIRPLAEGEK